MSDFISVTAAPLLLMFRRAISSAAPDSSVAATVARGNAMAMAIAMHPDPVQMSVTVPVKPLFSLMIIMVISSVSGLGMRTPGATSILCPQNSV